MLLLAVVVYNLPIWTSLCLAVDSARTAVRRSTTLAQTSTATLKSAAGTCIICTDDAKRHAIKCENFIFIHSSGLLSGWPSVWWPFVGGLLTGCLLSEWTFVRTTVGRSTTLTRRKSETHWQVNLEIRTVSIVLNGSWAENNILLSRN